MSELTTADKIALYVGGGLFVLGVFLIGLLEMLAGAEHPVDSEGQIMHDALISVEIRSAIIMLALLVWGGYAIYRVVATTPASQKGGRVA
jgi:protein-S-isoprenylcysteine O-methyltransferase Ste14